MKKPILYLILVCTIQLKAQIKTDSIEKILPSLKDTSRVNALNVLSKELYRVDLKKTKAYADEAFHLSTSLNFNKGKAEALSNNAIYSFMNGDNVAAISLIDSAINIGNEVNNLTLDASLLNIKGIVLFYGGDYKRSLDAFERSLVIKRKLNDPAEISKALSNIGSIYLKIGQYEKSLENYIEAQKIDESRKDSAALASDYLNIGGIYYDKNDFIKAKEYFLKCLNSPGTDKLMKANCLRNIGNVENTTGNTKVALEYYFRSLEIYEQMANKAGISANYNNIGLAYQNFKQYDKALDFFNRSVKIKLEIGDEPALASSYSNIGYIYNELNDFSKAKSFIEKGIDIGKKYRELSVVRNGYEKLTTIYAKLNDATNAIKSFDQYKKYNDSILNKESANGLAEMQTKYETEKKEKENQLLATENEVKALALSNERIVRNVILGLFAVIFVLVIILFNRNRLKHRNKLLIEKDLRNRAVFKAQEVEKAKLSQELHDGVGPLLSLIKLNVSSLDSNKENEKILHEIKELASEGMKEVRNISHALMPSLLEKKGLRAALEEFIDQINRAGKTNVSLTYNTNSSLNSDIEINIYRIVQEALNNILKHANASQAEIILNEKNNELELTIKDNGKGFDPSLIGNGNGMNNIYSRVDFLKGELKVNSVLGKETVFKIMIPIIMNAAIKE